LTNVDYNDGSETDYYYDSLGNRTSVVNGGTVNYLRNRLNQYYSVGGSSYSYEDNGNLTNDGTVGVEDLGVFVENWLAGK